MNADWQPLSLALLASLAELPMWQSFLAALAARFNADGAALVFDSPMPGDDVQMVFAHGLAMEDAARGWAAAFSQAEIGVPCQSETLLGMALAFMQGRRAWLVLRRAPGTLPFGLVQAKRFGMIGPLVQAGFAPFLTQIALAREQRIQAEVVSASDLAVLALDAHCRLLYANPQARDMLARRDGLYEAHGQVHCQALQDDARLRQLVRYFAGAQRAAPTPGLFEPLTVARSRAAHQLLTVLVRPGPSFAPVSVPLQRSAILIARDPARRPSLAVETLVHLFDMTPAEAALASRLAAGLSLEEAAAQLSISRNTARFQLQAIFRKTDTNRQAELVRLLLGSVATLSV